MPNKQYLAGRRWEYECAADLRLRGFKVIRASGSHGEYDLVAYAPDKKPIFIQCKRVESKTTGTRLVKNWMQSTKPEEHYHQKMMVRVKGKSETVEGTI